jgi:hypothetical protein
VGQVKLSKVLEIISISGILFLLLLLLLEYLGIISSPTFDEFFSGFLIFMYSELLALRLELRDTNFKVNLMWESFRKRKRIN